MAGRLFRTFTSGKPYHDVETGEPNPELDIQKENQNQGENQNQEENQNQGENQLPNQLQRGRIYQKHQRRKMQNKKEEKRKKSKSPQRKNVEFFDLEDSQDSRSSSGRIRSSRSSSGPQLGLIRRPFGMGHRSRSLESRIRRYQLYIYNFLDRPRGYKSLMYHLFV